MREHLTAAWTQLIHFREGFPACCEENQRILTLPPLRPERCVYAAEGQSRFGAFFAAAAA